MSMESGLELGPVVCLHPLALEGQPNQHRVIERYPGVLIMHERHLKDAPSRVFVQRGVLITHLSPLLGQGERLDELHVDLRGLVNLSSNFPIHFVAMRLYRWDAFSRFMPGFLRVYLTPNALRYTSQ